MPFLLPEINTDRSQNRTPCLCVYLPTDYGNDSSKQDLIYTLGELAGYILTNPTDELMIVGDFIVDFNRSQSQFMMTLSQFMYDHGLVAADQFFAHKIPYTYESDSGVGHSWIDRTLISRTGGCHVSDVSLVHSGSNLSDHSPMICTIIGVVGWGLEVLRNPQ